VRGYPIRTPSDHSSVDSSPRLIAASHVLHRLLVPRHPPCALKNLHTKTKNKRCSRPLCRSQTTNPQPTPGAANPNPQQESRRYDTGRPRETTNQTARSLRTQQRTTPATPPRHARSTPNRGVPDTQHDKTTSNSQRSTHEQPPPNTCRRNGNWTTHQRRTATCSLERR
jgi:hypothetical protein